MVHITGAQLDQLRHAKCAQLDQMLAELDAVPLPPGMDREYLRAKLQQERERLAAVPSTPITLVVQ